jgi:hypothetical protein
MRVAYSSIKRWQSETQNCAMGICGLHRCGLLGDSWLGYSNIRGTCLVGSRSFDMSDCGRQLGFSLRSQVVLGSCCEPSHICADRPNGGSSAGISKSVSRSGTVTVAKSRVHSQRSTTQIACSQQLSFLHGERLRRSFPNQPRSIKIPKRAVLLANRRPSSAFLEGWRTDHSKAFGE